MTRKRVFWNGGVGSAKIRRPRPLGSLQGFVRVPAALKTTKTVLVSGNPENFIPGFSKGAPFRRGYATDCSRTTPNLVTGAACASRDSLGGEPARFQIRCTRGKN